TLYNGFHLLYADLEAAFLSYSDGARVQHRELPPGIHLLTERSLGAGETEREGLVLSRLQALFAREKPTPAALRAAITFHGPEGAPFEGACVHADSFGYGTRSAFQLVIGDRGEASALSTEGSPCPA